MQKFLSNTLNNKLGRFVTVLFMVLVFWWLLFHFNKTYNTPEHRQLWAAVYQVIALYGAMAGLIISKQWGGIRSLVGKSIIAFSFGLFLQSFGQSVYSYYIYFLRIETPYPSIGDIGFFGSVVAYIIGVYILAKSSGIRFTVKTLHNRILAVFIPIVLLVGSYFFFLQNYEFDWSEPIKVLLDFGYPLGQAFYLAIAIVALILNRRVLGGVMRRPILFLISALLVQYVSDFTFLYQAKSLTWYAGGPNDFLYLISYFLMVVSLIQFDIVYKKIRDGDIT